MKLSEHDKGFVVGSCVAAGIIVSAFDQPTLAEEILQAAGITRAQAKRCGVDDYDMDLLVGLWAKTRRRK